MLDIGFRGPVTPVRFPASDGMQLELLRLESPDTVPGREVVLLVHGAGVRANIFLPPLADTLPQLLVRAGYDVWLLNWRASIDLPPNSWTLDQAAVLDYPAAIKKLRELTGADTVKAIIHCQGSTSFMMSIVAGLLPHVSLVISNAVALHPVVPTLARIKSRIATGPVSKVLDYLNPQWGLGAPGFWPKVVDWWVRATHHECNNPVCKHSSFTYGAGFPTLWSHANLDADTHEWLKGEFAHVPLSFFRQMQRSIASGVLVPAGDFPELPASFVASAPRTDARFVFLAGRENQCFLAEGMERTYDFFDRHAPGKHMLQLLAGYGHLDVFIGKNAARDVFPLIIDELARR